MSLLVSVVVGCSGQSAQGAKQAAMVNGHPISMSAYSTQVHLKRLSQSQALGQPDVCTVKIYTSLCKKLEQNALDDLINEELIREYASAHHIVVTQTDFNREWSAVFYNKFHADGAVLNAWAKTNGLRVSDVKSMVRENLLQQSVMYQITKYMSTRAPAVRVSRIAIATPKELRDVQLLLRHGRAFDVVASDLSGNKQSVCAQIGCGELGWIPDALVPARERTIVRTPSGKIAGPFASQGGYTLFLVEAHLPHYPMTPREQLAMRQQLFAGWVTQQRRKAEVRRFVAT